MNFRGMLGLVLGILAVSFSGVTHADEYDTTTFEGAMRYSICKEGRGRRNHRVPDTFLDWARDGKVGEDVSSAQLETLRANLEDTLRGMPFIEARFQTMTISRMTSYRVYKASNERMPADLIIGFTATAGSDALAYFMRMTPLREATVDNRANITGYRTRYLLASPTFFREYRDAEDLNPYKTVCGDATDRRRERTATRPGEYPIVTKPIVPVPIKELERPIDRLKR